MRTRDSRHEQKNTTNFGKFLIFVNFLPEIQLSPQNHVDILEKQLL
jgi:hypothetical protein